jgi:chemosensory pili system protein ChpA (sensor histidine kinase/response regulator)
METVSDLTSITSFMEEERRDTDTLLQQQARVTTDLQDGLLRTRMVPFSQLVPRLHRLVRQTCKTLEKKAELEIWGAEGEIDRRILERIIGPLEHLLRNAVSHGIERPNRRLKEKKPEVGKISMSVSREGTEVVIDIADDGAGIPVDAVRRRAVEKGLLDPHAEIRDADVMRFILEHGFSTADEVTQISGRGVGLDVVVSEVKQIGGSVDLASKAGEGTRFQIRLPLTLAISDALLIKLSDEVYAIPHTVLEGVIRVAKDELRDCYGGNKEQINYATIFLRYNYHC